MTTTKKTDAPLAPAAWWQDELTRREANRRVLAGGALVAGVAAIGATSAGCTSNSEPTE